MDVDNSVVVVGVNGIWGLNGNGKIYNKKY